MNPRTLALAAAIGATLIYALNHTLAKGLMPGYITPYALILLRVIGGAILFLAISFFGPKEVVEKRDYPRFLVCALMGMGINMLVFFKGLSLSTPINSAVIVTTTPLIVLMLSIIWLGERTSLKKVSGIVIGGLGALGLILLGPQIRRDAPDIPMGNLLILMNSFFYGSYLILVKKLIEKYHPFTAMKWLFTLGIVLCLPFGLEGLSEVQWSALPFYAWWRILFVVVGTTFLTYLFNIYALTQLKASTLSAFVYVQPLIGILFAVLMGEDGLTLLKVVAAGLVLLGVYLSSVRSQDT